MNGKHVFDGMPESLIHSAEEGATKIAEAVETAGARVARSAGQVAKNAGQASGKASELSGQLKGRVAQAPVAMKGTKLGMREKRVGMMQTLSRSMLRRQTKMLPNSTDALVKAQLVKTSRELAHESSDLSAAVDSLNKIIKANRRAAAKSRTRLLGGLAMGAALMYHLDSEHGRERRAATGQLVTRMIRGTGQPPTAAS